MANSDRNRPITPQDIERASELGQVYNMDVVDKMTAVMILEILNSTKCPIEHPSMPRIFSFIGALLETVYGKDGK